MARRYVVLTPIRGSKRVKIRGSFKSKADAVKREKKFNNAFIKVTDKGR